VEYTLTQPLVSIFIPCYNEEKTIGLLLDAIRNQTYPLDHLEVVIADASSTDGTRQVIANYQQMHPEMRIHGGGESQAHNSRRFECGNPCFKWGNPHAS